MQQNEQALLEALNVWNRVIDRHQDSFPYRDILPRCEEALRGVEIGVEVYHNADPGRPVSRFTVQLRDGRIQIVNNHPGVEVRWKVSRDSLKEIAKNAQVYLDNPVKLDWDWLTHPAGISI